MRIMQFASQRRLLVASSWKLWAREGALFSVMDRTSTLLLCEQPSTSRGSYTAHDQTNSLSRAPLHFSWSLTARLPRHMGLSFKHAQRAQGGQGRARPTLVTLAALSAQHTPQVR